MKVKLGTVIFEYSVRNKTNEDIPVYSVTNEQGFCTGYFSKDVSSKDRTTYKIVPRGYFAYNPSRINVGSIDWQDCEEKVIVSPLYVVFGVNNKLNQRYLLHYLKSDIALTFIRANATGSVRDNLKFSVLSEFPVKLLPIEQQEKIADILDAVDNLISSYKKEIETLDSLVKSRFIEMFGNLRENPMQWPIKHFNEFAEIDANMTTNYEKYADYPHIGIDSIEKGTGELKGYRTVKEDGVISGKYIFTPQHIIYSKIRPNLNKVALPNFDGLCSADAYPILPKQGICNRVFLAVAMRSEFFLEYILQFSSRTNLPKVNRKEISGFCMPLPPLDLQENFACFVAQTDKSKLAIQKSLDELETLKKALMQKYFS